MVLNARSLKTTFNLSPPGYQGLDTFYSTALEEIDFTTMIHLLDCKGIEMQLSKCPHLLSSRFGQREDGSVEVAAVSCTGKSCKVISS